jgi:hypothetical protein
MDGHGRIRKLRLARRLSELTCRHKVCNRIQVYSMNIPRQALPVLLASGNIVQIHDAFNILTHRALYQSDVGLYPEGAEQQSIENLIA